MVAKVTECELVEASTGTSFTREQRFPDSWMFPDSSHSGYSDSHGVYTTGEFGFLGILPTLSSGFKIFLFMTKAESFDSGFTFWIVHGLKDVLKHLSLNFERLFNWEWRYILHFPLLTQYSTLRTPQLCTPHFPRDQTAKRILDQYICSSGLSTDCLW